MTILNRRPSSYELLEINIIEADDEELNEISAKLGLGLSLNELRYIKEHYVKENRKATDIELQTYDQTFSEHCSHKTFKAELKTPQGKIDGLLNSYIRKVVEELETDWTLSVFKDNAGIVEFDEDYGIAVKVETHNHPSAIEPFGGAATGLGGVIRDVLGVWAEPIACTDVLCFGPLDYDYKQLPDGVKHPSYLFSGIIDGIGSYGNSMGIPTVNGATVFDEGYVGNVVVYAGCVGIIKKDHYITDVRVGDFIVLAGGRTGLDGIHGVTFASTELNEDSETESRPAVQIANPIEEEKIKRAIKTISERKLGTGITDIGGGGISCGICETADRYGLGAEVELEKIHLKYPNMAPWEIWISESQERMLLAVPPENLEEVVDVFHSEQVEANVLGSYVKGDYANITYRGDLVGKIHLKSLFNPPKIKRSISWQPKNGDEPFLKRPPNLGAVLNKLLTSYNIASKERVVRRYDQEVKGQTVVKPLQGWFAGPNDAAVLKPLKNSWKGISISSGINSSYGKINPYWMASSAIDEAIRNNIAVGGRRIAMLDNFTWGNPEYTDRIGGLIFASRACYDVAKVYGTPFISGKDSLYNESPLGPVTPTLLITGLGIVPDVRKAVTMELKESGNSLYLLGETKPELGGSEYYRLNGALGSTVPKLEPMKTSKSYNKLTEAIDKGLIRACHDLSEGGLAVAASEMAFTGDLGLEIDLQKVKTSSKMRPDYVLFSESNGRLLVEVKPENNDLFEEIMNGTLYSKIGFVKKEKNLTIKDSKNVILNEGLTRLITSWKTPLEART